MRTEDADGSHTAAWIVLSLASPGFAIEADDPVEAPAATPASPGKLCRERAAAVVAAIVGDPAFKWDTTHLEIHFRQDGLTTLYGRVSSGHLKRRAEALAKKVPGVTEVQNRLKAPVPEKPRNQL